MRQLNAYVFTTLNGYYCDMAGGIDWHVHRAEEESHSEGALQQESTLMFGRKTYQMMAEFWPTAMAKSSMPTVAEGMNRAEKLVFSRTLSEVDWENTRMLKGELVDEVIKLKEGDGPDITILGSGNLLAQLADAGLIDQYELMIDPVVLGKGKTLFDGITSNLNLKLVDSKVFNSGVLSLRYAPVLNASPNV